MSHLLRRVAIVALLALGSSVPAFARSVTVAWDANTESDLAGYVVHYGTAPGTYTASVDVGNRTDFALDLDELTTYYVAVDAYNATGEHSPLSSEVVVGPDYSVCDFSLNTTNTSVGPSASSLTVGLTTQSVCPWTASSFSNWITVSGRTATRGAGTVSLSIAANSTGTSRVGTVVIGRRALLVTQGSASCTVSASAADFGLFLKEGGSGSVAVSASGAQCGWTAASDASWLAVGGATSRNGSGNVGFAVAANSGAAREAHLTIAGSVFTIQQQARKRIEALDFDGLGADAFLYDARSGDWTRYKWTGIFSAMQSGAASSGLTVLPADFNRDDRSDLFAYNPLTGGWARSVAAEDGSISLLESIWQAGWVPTIADFNGDGRSDVLFYNPRSGAWVQWITQPSMDFVQRSGQFGAGWTLYRARFDGDVRDDLLLYNANPKKSDRNAGKWAQAFTQADLSFVIKPGKKAWSAGATILPVDFTGDGLSEVFMLSTTGKWTVATFGAKGVSVKIGGWSAGWQVFRAEFNGDNVPDLFLFNPKNGQYRLVLRKGSGFTLVRGAWSKGLTADVTDVNADGLTDIIVYHAAQGIWGSATSTKKPGAFVYGGGTFGTSLTLLARHQTQP